MERQACGAPESQVRLRARELGPGGTPGNEAWDRARNEARTRAATRPGEGPATTARRRLVRDREPGWQLHEVHDVALTVREPRRHAAGSIARNTIHGGRAILEVVLLEHDAARAQLVHDGPQVLDDEPESRAPGGPRRGSLVDRDLRAVDHVDVGAALGERHGRLEPELLGVPGARPLEVVRREHGEGGDEVGHGFLLRWTAAALLDPLDGHRHGPAATQA